MPEYRLFLLLRSLTLNQMLKINLKKYNSIFLISLLLGGIFYAFLPAQALQITDYPSFLDISEDMSFIELVSTLFNFLLLLAGLAALMIIIWGGIRYLTSVGDSSKMSDAKGQIFSAILGVVILFASWMILNTINPNLVELTEPGFTTTLTDPVVTPVRVVGTCAEGEDYAVEIYPEAGFDGDRKCFKAGEQKSSYNEKIYSIKLDNTTIKLFDEAGFDGRNICFRGDVLDLGACILAGRNDCPLSEAGWEKPKSFQIGATCSSLNSGVTLSASGEQIWQSCPLPPHEGFIPTCTYR